MSKDRLLDQVKLQIFRNRSVGALFGPLTAGIDWIWSDKIPTAATNFTTIMFNYDWFSKLTKSERLGLVMHEMEHIMRLHDIRRGDRDPQLWNIACDLLINRSLTDDGYKLPEGGLLDFELLRDNNLESEEEAYDYLMKNDPDRQLDSFGDGEGDLVAIEPEEGGSAASKARELVNAVSTAINQAKLSGQAGQIPGSTVQTLNDFLNPQLPWNRVLRKHFIELGGMPVNSWNRRNRRFPNIFMPGKWNPPTNLSKVMFFLDTSGSVSEEDLAKQVTEIKYVQEVLQPLELHLVQFDHEIQKVDVYRKGQRIKFLEVKGRGGTFLDPVKEYIDTHKPTVVCVFSDLFCSPMDNPNVPTFFIVPEGTQSYKYAWTPDYGTLLEVK